MENGPVLDREEWFPYFEKARDLIRFSFGIMDLSLSQQIDLRNITREVSGEYKIAIAEVREGGPVRSLYNPSREIVARFLSKEYDLSGLNREFVNGLFCISTPRLQGHMMHLQDKQLLL